jgi:hypothetical protein
VRLAGAVVEVKSSLESAADEPGMMAQDWPTGETNLAKLADGRVKAS